MADNSALHTRQNGSRANSVHGEVAAPAALRPKQETFAQRYAAHGNAARAYREAFDCDPGMHATTARRRGYELVHEPAIAARVRELLVQAAEGTTISARARMVRLQEIVEADPGELVRVVCEACRWCHGQGHAYQWVDGAEYAQALRIAMVAHKARPRAERPLPTDEGGYGFDPRREPHEDCPRCGGEGQQSVRLTPTDALSPAARKLLKGVRQKASGEIEVRLHDQLEALDMLNRMQGVYVERSVSLTASVALPAPKEWTREERLAFLESLRPTT
jgi:phage terminase small subunit